MSEKVTISMKCSDRMKMDIDSNKEHKHTLVPSSLLYQSIFLNKTRLTVRKLTGALTI